MDYAEGILEGRAELGKRFTRVSSGEMSVFISSFSPRNEHVHWEPRFTYWIIHIKHRPPMPLSLAASSCPCLPLFRFSVSSSTSTRALSWMFSITLSIRDFFSRTRVFFSCKVSCTLVRLVGLLRGSQSCGPPSAAGRADCYS